MTKRRRSKATTAAKAKADDKEIAVKSSDTEEKSSKTSSKNASSQESVNASPSKKPKLDSYQSPTTRNSKKYVPPFTAPQTRSRRESLQRKINQSCSPESKVKSPQAQRSSADIKDKKSSEAPINKEQHQIVLEAEKVEDEDINKAKKGETSLGENVSVALSSQNQRSNEKDESSNNFEHDGNIATFEKAGKQGNMDVIHQQVPKLVDLKCFEVGEEDGIIIKTRKESGSVKAGGNSKSSESEKSKLDSSATIDGAAQLTSVSSLRILADACTEVGRVGVVSEKSESSQREIKNTSNEETKNDELSKERKINGRKSSNSKDPAEEKIPDSKCETILLQQQEVTAANGIGTDPSKPNTSSTKLSEQIRVTESLVSPMNPSLSDVDSAKKTGDFQSKSPSHEGTSDDIDKCTLELKLQNSGGLQEYAKEIIERKLSEMLSCIVGEKLPSSQTKSQDIIGASPMYENTSKRLDDAPTPDVHIEKMPPDRDDSRPGGSQGRCVGKCESENATSDSKSLQNKFSIERILKPCEVVSANDGCASVTKDIMEDANNKISVETSQRSKNVVIMEDANNKISVETSQTSKNVDIMENANNKISVETSQRSKNVVIMEDANNKISAETSQTKKEVENGISERMELQAKFSDVVDKNNNDQEVPGEMMTSPTSSKESNTSDVLKNEVNQSSETCSHGEVTTALLNPNEHATLDTSHDSKDGDASLTKADIPASFKSNTVDELSFAKEFEALEELLPDDDMGLFDDVIMSQPKCTRSQESELPDGDRTMQFIINELTSITSMVANYERAVEDMKRQYKFNARF